jgi:hypothetical protein
MVTLKQVFYRSSEMEETILIQELTQISKSQKLLEITFTSKPSTFNLTQPHIAMLFTLRSMQ